MYHKFFLLASVFLFGCNDNVLTSTCESSEALCIDHSRPSVGPVALSITWVDNGPSGGNAYRAKFRATPGGNYTSSLDVENGHIVDSIGIVFRKGSTSSTINGSLLSIENYSGEVSIVSTADVSGEQIVFSKAFDVDRAQYNYRIDLSVPDTSGGFIDIVSPPLVRYAQ